MALSYNEYTANGTDVMFVSKPYLKAEHLAVYVDGVLQTPTSYTVSGTTVTFNSAPVTNSVVRIGRLTNQESRLIDYQDGSLLTEAVLDADANQLFYMAQEAIDAAKETDLAGVTFYASSANAPANPSLGDLWYDQNNKYLKIFDGGAWKLATPANETHTFDNSFFNVSGSYSYINVANLTEDAFVFLNGVKQVKAAAQADVLVPTGGDYYLDLANSRVYLAPLDSTDTVEITIAPASLGETSNTQVETLIATAGQTVFDLTKPYIPGTNTLHVYVNGIRQSAYEETLNTRVTFANGLSTGDEVVFIINQYTQSYNFTDASNVTYAASGAGAIATTVKEKLQELVSVKDFGAKGDGVTDDTAALQAAITSSNKVDLVGGTYRVDGTLTLTSNSELINGVLDYSNGTDAVPCVTASGSLETPLNLTNNATEGSTTLQTADTTSLAASDWLLVSSDAVFDDFNTDSKVGEFVQILEVTNSTTVTIKSKLIDSYQTSDTATITKVNFVENIVLTDVAILGSVTNSNGFQGFQAFFCNNVVVDKCRFENLTHHGIQLVSCINSKATNNYFENSVLDETQGYGLSFANCTQDCIGSGNSFNYLRHSFSTNNLGSYSGVPRRVTFMGNTVTNSATSQAGSGGDAIDTHGAAEDINITNNTCYGSTGVGINFECRSGSIIGNRIFDSTSDGIKYHNEADSSGRLVIANNRVVRSGGKGINCIQGFRGTSATFVSLSISGNNVENSQGAGIYLDYTNSKPRNINITGNNVYHSLQDGLYASSLIGVSITGNTFRLNEKSGIDIRDSEAVSLSGNVIQKSSDNSESCVYLSTCDGFSFNANSIQVEAGTGEALDVRGTNKNYTISGNNIRSDASAPIVHLAASSSTDTSASVTGNTVGAYTGSSSEYGIALNSNINYCIISSNNVRGTGGIQMSSGTGHVNQDNIV